MFSKTFYKFYKVEENKSSVSWSCVALISKSLCSGVNYFATKLNKEIFNWKDFIKSIESICFIEEGKKKLDNKSFVWLKIKFNKSIEERKSNKNYNKKETNHKSS